MQSNFYLHRVFYLLAIVAFFTMFFRLVSAVNELSRISLQWVLLLRYINIRPLMDVVVGIYAFIIIFFLLGKILSAYRPN